MHKPYKRGSFSDQKKKYTQTASYLVLRELLTQFLSGQKTKGKHIQFLREREREKI